MRCLTCQYGHEVLDTNVFRIGESGEHINDRFVTSCRLQPEWKHFENDHYCFQYKRDFKKYANYKARRAK